MSALKSCEACKKEFSVAAKACPNCAHPNNPPKSRWILKTFVIVFGVGWIINSVNKHQETNLSSAAPSIPQPKTEAQIKQEKLRADLEKQFGPAPTQNGLTGSYSEVKNYLKKAANDPGSIDIEGCTDVTIDKKNGWVVGCNYRGKNAFGALILKTNWFVIKNGAVVKMLPPDSYKQ